MKFFRDFSPKLLLLTLTIITYICLNNPLTAFAVGPVDPGAVPGGVTVVDSDTSGEAWGRSGGRSVTYTLGIPSNFTSMTWGAVGPNPVQLAFDGNIDAFGETLVLDNTLSNFAGGVAVWTGQAIIPLSGFPDLNLPTRFTLTVVDGSSVPIPLASVPGENVPGINVLSPGGPFTATLLFEADHDGTHSLPSGWTPVLDLFDNLPTQAGNPPGGGGPVLTSFTSGFFFNGETGISIDEHDSNMLAQTNMIKNDIAELDGKVEFIKIDAINRLIQLASDHDEIHDWVNSNHSSVINTINNALIQVLASIDEIPEFPNFPTDVASSEDVNQVREELQNILLILFGIFPCPPDAGALCDSATFISDLATKEDLTMVKDNLQVLLEKSREIKVQAVSIPGGPSRR